MKGKLQNNDDKQALIEYINKLEIKKPYSWEIKRQITKRSLSANALYWVWMTCVADETGQDKYSLHEAFKQMFLSPDIVILGDREIATRTTRRLSTSQFAEYMERVRAEVAVIGIILPDPDDLIFESFVSEYKDKL